MPNDCEHTKYLHWLLDRKGWERKAVAEELCATKGCLSKWLSGQSAPNKAAQAKIEAMAAAHGHAFPVGSDLPQGAQVDPYTGMTWPRCETEFRFSDCWGGFLPPLRRHCSVSIVLMFHEMIYLLTQTKVCVTRQSALDTMLAAYEQRCREWWTAKFVDGAGWRDLEGGLDPDLRTRHDLMMTVIERLFPLGPLGGAATERSPQHLEDYISMHCWLFQWNHFARPNYGLEPCNGVESLPPHCTDSTFDWEKKIWVAA